MESQNKRQTNIWDVLVTIINGLFNLLKIEKIACIAVVYLLARDAYFSYHISDPAMIKEYLISAAILEEILLNDNSLVVVLAFVIVFLLSGLIASILVIKFVYKKEIDRLSSVRSELLHSEGTPLKVHNTSSVKS